MKKTKLHSTLSKRLRDAIIKDLKDAYDEACYETFDHHGTLSTLQELGVKAMPHTEYILKELEQMENNSFSKLHDTWDIKRPFGIGNLNDD